MVLLTEEKLLGLLKEAESNVIVSFKNATIEDINETWAHLWSIANNGEKYIRLPASIYGESCAFNFEKSKSNKYYMFYSPLSFYKNAKEFSGSTFIEVNGQNKARHAISFARNKSYKELTKNN